MLKQLFILIFSLIADPNKAWEHLAGKLENKNENFYMSYLYPVFGLIALSSFAGVLISAGEFDLQNALKTVIKQIVVYFGGFYLASFLLSKYVTPRFRGSKDALLSERFVGYSSSLIYVVAIIQSLFPSFFLLPLILFYSIYIIWVGAIRYMAIQEKDIVKFTAWASIIILLSPRLIEGVMKLFLPGLGK
jgi:hypothetical protein